MTGEAAGSVGLGGVDVAAVNPIDVIHPETGTGSPETALRAIRGSKTHSETFPTTNGPQNGETGIR